jgi:hypothetical protein
MSSARSKVLQVLAQRIHEIEASAPPCRQPPPLGIAPLEKLLPEGRLPAGSLVELLSASEGAGTWTLALVMAKHVCGADRVLVVVDGQDCFYPPAAARLGIDLDRSIVVHPRNRRDTVLAMNLSLRCSAIGAVVGAIDPLSTLDARRLQLAAEAGGSVGFLFRPRRALRTPSFANLRLMISPVASDGEKVSGTLKPKVPDTFSPDQAARCLRVEVVRCRAGKSGQSVLLEVSDEAIPVRELPDVAAPAPGPRVSRIAE